MYEFSYGLKEPNIKYLDRKRELCVTRKTIAGHAPNDLGLDIVLNNRRFRIQAFVPGLNDSATRTAKACCGNSLNVKAEQIGIRALLKCGTCDSAFIDNPAFFAFF